MVMLQQSLKTHVSREFMGAAMTLDMRKCPSPVAVKLIYVLAAGLVICGPEI